MAVNSCSESSIRFVFGSSSKYWSNALIGAKKMMLVAAG
jgi:hypothetical protein